MLVTGFRQRAAPASMAEAAEVTLRRPALWSSVLDAVLLLLNLWLLAVLTRAALSVLQGRTPSVPSVFAAVRARWKAIVVFSLVLAAGDFLLAVSAVARPLAVLSLVLRSLWMFALYLGLPVVVREPGTGLDAVRRAWALIRRSWTTRLAGIAILLAASLGTIIGFMLLTFALSRFFHHLPNSSFDIVAYSLLISAGASTIFFLAVDQVFDAALYVMLTEGVLPGAPAPVDAAATWRARA
jgi:hypothetical protein